MNLDYLLTDRWHIRQGAKPEEIRLTESHMGVRFPEDYRELIAWSNGADLLVGSNYFRMWSLRDVIELNMFWEIQSNMPQTIAIGDDASDTLYLLDYRDSATQPSLIEVEAGSLYLGKSLTQGNSIGDTFRVWSGIDAARARLLRCLAARVVQERMNDAREVIDG